MNEGWERNILAWEALYGRRTNPERHLIRIMARALAWRFASCLPMSIISALADLVRRPLW